MEYSITLNMPNDLSDSEWNKVTEVYKQMDGWLDGLDYPSWYGTESDAQYIIASIEPSGLVIYGKINQLLWFGWVTKLCAKLSIALGREVYDAEI